MQVERYFKPGSVCAVLGEHMDIREQQCVACADWVDWCADCEVNTSCCQCGRNHSMDCEAL